MHNFFSLFELPVSFDVDLTELEKRYFSVQRECHPDRLVGKDSEQRQKAIARSMQANEAFDLLKSPLLRARHLLALQGVQVGGEKDTVKPSPALLMEVMEWREALEEITIKEKLALLNQQIHSDYERVIAALTALFAVQQWQGAAEATLRLSYLTKLKEELRLKTKVLG